MKTIDDLKNNVFAEYNQNITGKTLDDIINESPDDIIHKSIDFTLRKVCEEIDTVIAGDASMPRYTVEKLRELKARLGGGK